MTCKLQDPVDSPASTASNTKSRPSPAGSKRTQRSAAWLTAREHATEWNNGFSRLLKDYCRRRDWQGYRREYVARIQPILVVMRTSPRAWIRKQYARQCEQFHTSDTLRMAEAIRHIMKNGNTSCIYTLFSQQHDKPYRGLVYQRPAMLRMTEHIAELCTITPGSDDKYKGMARQAPPWEWLFMPYMPCEGVLPEKELEAVERYEIRKGGISWNTYHNPYMRKQGVVSHDASQTKVTNPAVRHPPRYHRERQSTCTAGQSPLGAC